jgi:CBS domain-containing protein
MARRITDNGKGDTRGTHPPRAGESPTHRGADVSPPGSRERGEAHVTGWSPEKEAESMELRQGPFHRAATERLYNPRGGRNAGDVGPLQDGRIVHGPSSMEDREDAGTREAARRAGSRHEPHRGFRARDEDTLRWDDTARTWREDTGGGRSERPSRGEYDARAEGRRRWAREPLTAREIMTRGVKSVRRDSPLREVAQLMKDEDCGVVPIVDERGTLLGLVTDRDLVIRAFTGAQSPDTLRAGDVMTDDVRVVTPEEDIHSVIELMGRQQVRRVPVVDRDDRLLGIISMGDIANRADYDEELQEALDRVSARRSFWNRLG